MPGLVAEGWRRLRAWRRIRFTRAGAFVTLGALAVGLAATATGNNLLHLLLGALLGAMAVSGWLSEHTLRRLDILRQIPAGIPVGSEFRIRYRVRNLKPRLASWAVELQEPGLPGLALVPRVGAGQAVEASARQTFVQRGVYPLRSLTLATEFPFGLFRKERDVPLSGEVVVWPRADRSVPDALVTGSERPVPTALPATSETPGARGEFRSLREYRPGDDARDIHWRTSARLRRPVIREYDRDAGSGVWIVLDTTRPAGRGAEGAVEVAASLCARAARAGRPFALAAGPHRVEPGSGQAHLERALDALARVDFPAEGETGPPPPSLAAVPRDRAVFVTTPDGPDGPGRTVRAAPRPDDTSDNPVDGTGDAGRPGDGGAEEIRTAAGGTPGREGRP